MLQPTGRRDGAPNYNAVLTSCATVNTLEYWSKRGRTLADVNGLLSPNIGWPYRRGVAARIPGTPLSLPLPVGATYPRSAAYTTATFLTTAVLHVNISLPRSFTAPLPRIAFTDYHPDRFFSASRFLFFFSFLLYFSVAFGSVRKIKLAIHDST